MRRISIVPIFMGVIAILSVVLAPTLFPDHPDWFIAGVVTGGGLGVIAAALHVGIMEHRRERREWDNYRKTWWKNGGSLQRSVGCVYFVKAAHGRYKIGRTKDIESRLSELQTANHERLSVELVIPTDEPEVMERWLHRKYERKRMGGEWFALSRRDMRWVIGEVEKVQQQQMAQHT